MLIFSSRNGHRKMTVVYIVTNLIEEKHMLRELLHPFQAIYDTHCYQINFDSAVPYHDSDYIPLDNSLHSTAGYCWVVPNTLGHSIGVLSS